MIESSEKLEKELFSLRPRPLSGELIERIEAHLLENRSGDGLLKFSMSLGALAACLIVALLWVEPRDSASSSTPEIMPSRIAKPYDVPPVFAWADRHLQLHELLETP